MSGSAHKKNHYVTPKRKQSFNDRLCHSEPPYFEMGAPLSRKTKRRDRGLKILSEQVKDLVIRRKNTTFSQVSNELIKLQKIEN